MANKLSELDKMEIYASWKVHGNQWKIIGLLTGHLATTCASFIKSFEKHKSLFPKRGPPFEITKNEKDSVVSVIMGNPEYHLSDLSGDTNISPSQCKKILNDNGIYYFERVAVPPLTAEHVQNRWNFVRQFLHTNYFFMPNIIFTDESTVVVDLDNGGIWRFRGQIPPEGFYTKISHPVQVMVWAGIGPHGFRTKLIKCEGHITAKKYAELLHNNNIIDNIKAVFGQNFIWMQDNAPSHTGHDAIMYLHQNIPGMLNWPARSPDLNPIEQLWSYIKRKIKGMTFRNADHLFNTLSEIWDNIPDETIHQYYSSFKARCQACDHIKGECLNGKWVYVKRYHNSYRTKLVKVNGIYHEQFIGSRI